MTITIITGWIAAVLLFFNFLTCLAMPWANKNLNKNAKNCKPPENCKECEIICLGKYHKPIVYLSIISIIVHVAASLMT